MDSRNTYDIIQGEKILKLKKILQETEVEELRRLFKDRSYAIESVNGKIIKIETNDKKIIAWAKGKELIE